MQAQIKLQMMSWDRINIRLLLTRESGLLQKINPFHTSLDHDIHIAVERSPDDDLPPVHDLVELEILMRPA
ncbi:MAG TPA: hypothetical protein V6D20_01475 [Candidatus Obscuribacterales bacterium]